MQFTVDIPDEFVPLVSQNGSGDVARTLLEAAVADAYRTRRITMEQARRLLGFDTRMQVDAFLQQHEIYDYTVDDLTRDIAVMERMTAVTESTTV